MTLDDILARPRPCPNGCPLPTTWTRGTGSDDSTYWYGQCVTCGWEWPDADHAHTVADALGPETVEGLRAIIREERAMALEEAAEHIDDAEPSGMLRPGARMFGDDNVGTVDAAADWLRARAKAEREWP